MHDQTISVEEVLLKERTYFLVDVRSPGEFARASIPGAVNVPIFDDEERKTVGKFYKENGVLEARLKGIEIVSPKLYSLVKKIIEISEGEKVVFYCWRGGMRSRAMVKIFKLAGLHAYQLQGGYKAYRRFIYGRLSNYDLKQRLIVLNGLTGTGKTEVIRRLSSRWPAVDLEEMARHRGSVFGNLGMEPPRSQKDFEALLWCSLYRFRDEPFIIVEGEGRRIGPLFLPEFMIEGINKGIHILLVASLETRTRRILKEYTSMDKNLIIQQAARSIKYLEKKLGKEKIRGLLDYLYQGDFYTVVKTLCRDHYDLQYNESKIGANVFELIVDGEDLERSVEEIDKFLEKLTAGKKDYLLVGEENESVW